ARLLDGLVTQSHRLGAEERRHRLPDVHQTQSGPHAPGGEAPEIEVVTIAHLAIHRIAQVGGLRRAVLEIQVVDERERHREHQRAEVPETSSVSLVMNPSAQQRSEEHTSELQSRENLVCRLLLEKTNEKTKS